MRRYSVKIDGDTVITMETVDASYFWSAVYGIMDGIMANADTNKDIVQVVLQEGDREFQMMTDGQIVVRPGSGVITDNWYELVTEWSD